MLDLHWNPVRLIQRMGRVDCQMNPDVEEKLLEDHPEHKKLRGEVAYWNRLPPGELDGLLRLYSRVSSIFGNEGGRSLRQMEKEDL